MRLQTFKPEPWGNVHLPPPPSKGRQGAAGPPGCHLRCILPLQAWRTAKPSSGLKSSIQEIPYGVRARRYRQIDWIPNSTLPIQLCLGAKQSVSSLKCLIYMIAVRTKGKNTLGTEMGTIDFDLSCLFGLFLAVTVSQTFIEGIRKRT